VDFRVLYRSEVATFRIGDSGPGIAKDDLGHIFEPFVRGRAERNRLSPGLGLGLTITKLLSETLGGEITVESEPGRGSAFQVRLMLARVDRPVAIAAQDRSVRGYKGPRRTIMVVDDNAEHREMMRQMLQPLDFTVLTAVDGPDCLTLIESANPDLLFVDILMPGMTGWELVQRLREGGVPAPIIMLSANVGDDIARANRDAGHNDAMAKPFSLRQLLEKIAAQLGLEWAEEGAGGHPAPAIRGNGQALRSPGVEHLDELLSLGRIGHVRGIDRKLAELASAPENLPLVEMLRAHMEVYDFTGYTELLERVGRHE
jgi:CheY-like chemotaxis protein